VSLSNHVMDEISMRFAYCRGLSARLLAEPRSPRRTTGPIGAAVTLPLPYLATTPDPAAAHQGLASGAGGWCLLAAEHEARRTRSTTGPCQSSSLSGRHEATVWLTTTSRRCSPDARPDGLRTDPIFCQPPNRPSPHIGLSAKLIAVQSLLLIFGSGGTVFEVIPTDWVSVAFGVASILSATKCA
jgi:hypothetical protein